MAVILLPSLPPNIGRFANEYGMRNGVVPPGPELRSLARLSNRVLGARGKQLGSFYIGPGTDTTTTYSDSFNSTTAADTLRLRFHTSPAAGGVVARHWLIPTDDTIGNAPTPAMRWTTTVDGGGSTNQAYIYQPNRVTSGSNIVPDQISFVDQVWTSISADTSYQAVLNQDDKIRVIGCEIWEVPRASLDTSSDTYAVDETIFHAAAPIYATAISDIVAATRRMHRRQGAVLFNASVPNTTAFRGGIASATATNIVDGTTGAWATDAGGWQIDPQYRSTLEKYNSGTSRETLSVHCWVAVKTSDAAQTATVVFRDQNATIATLTHTGDTTITFKTTTTTWSAPSNATMKVDVMASCSGGATASVYACGMYLYEA